ncbi:MAG: putative sugar nucleotidyl transferase [Gemmatimonadetes bacterium]|nr:putative sugar nucleotidyl transferase [Gemmatimonadota bacterium]
MSGPLFVLYDDSTARAAEPFALTRPFSELRAGAVVIRKRWERALGGTADGVCCDAHLRAYDELGAPAARSGTIAAGTVIVNSRFAPTLDAGVAALAPGDSLRADGKVVAVALGVAMSSDELADGAASLDRLASRDAGSLDGWWMENAWDLVRHLPEMLTADARVLADDCPDGPPAHISVLGEHRLAVQPGAYLEPHVVVDTTNGDVVIMEGARIGAFTRLAGPCVIGRHARIESGRITTSAIGEHSRVCGEMSVVIVAGHANKAHDGFVGHSVIGRWANLGAGTTTSNLKNSYGAVRMRDTRGEHDTGMQFLGSLVGDHAKLAIGTRLMTGTIVGAGANVFGDRAPDKFVPPFAWGDRAPFQRYELAKFLSVAEHVMRRRGVDLSAGMHDTLAAAWEASR